jgi:ABC-type transporter Mla MlaB component
MQTIVLQAIRQAFENRYINVLIVDLSAMQLTDNSALKALIGVVEQVEGPQLAIFFVGAPNGLVSLLQDDENKEKLSHVCLVKSIQDISTEDIIKLTENKVHEQDGIVVTTPTLPAPTSRSAVDEVVGGSAGAASVQPMQPTGFTPKYVPQMGYPIGGPGQPVYGSA